MDDCPICQKHRGEGPLPGMRVWSSDLVEVWHLLAVDGLTPLGHLLIESVRHAPYVDDLTDDEAAAVGRAVTAASRSLRAELDIDFVHAAVIGTAVAHFHQHVYVRFVGTPDEYTWDRSDEWPGAPSGDRSQVEALAARLARHFTRELP